MFGYFLKIPFFRSEVNLVKGSCLEILLKIAGFHNFAKSREKLMFGDFLEIISGLSLMSYVKSRERLVFGYFSLLC